MSAKNLEPVGVIGGVGPLATAYFLRRIVEQTEAHNDQDHVDVLVLNHATIPDRTAYILGESSENPGPVLARDAQRLEAFGVSFIVMPCNTAHYFTQQVIDAIEGEFLSIIDVTVNAVTQKFLHATKVGLLATAGTVSSQVYQDAFGAVGIEVITPTLEDQQAINEVIYSQVKAGLPSDVTTIRAVAQRLIDQGAATVILGCTELSVAAVDHDLLDDPMFCDSMDQLVRATIEHSGHTVRHTAH